jgi:hypothetical protein
MLYGVRISARELCPKSTGDDAGTNLPFMPTLERATTSACQIVQTKRTQKLSNNVAYARIDKEFQVATESRHIGIRQQAPLH